jgi:S-adenosylmethionine synthetase
VDLIVRRADAPLPGSLHVEVVERKGLGHPDTICDAIAEQGLRATVSSLPRTVRRILHRNVDKVLFVGGSAHTWFGGGEVTLPIEIYLAGRATWEYQGEHIPIHELAIDACDAWLRKHIPGLDKKATPVVTGVRIVCAVLTMRLARMSVAMSKLPVSSRQPDVEPADGVRTWCRQPMSDVLGGHRTRAAGVDRRVSSSQ